MFGEWQSKMSFIFMSKMSFIQIMESDLVSRATPFLDHLFVCRRALMWYSVVLGLSIHPVIIDVRFTTFVCQFIYVQLFQSVCLSQVRLERQAGASDNQMSSKIPLISGIRYKPLYSSIFMFKVFLNFTPFIASRATSFNKMNCYFSPSPFLGFA